MITEQDYLDIANAVWYHPNAITLETRFREAWGRLGLNPDEHLYCGTTSITFGEIAQALSEVSGNVIVTRT